MAWSLMLYFLDTEFYERPGRIDLISIGIAADDGRQYYAVNAEFDWTFPEVKGLGTALRGLARSPNPALETPRWLIENVRPYLRGRAMQLATIRSNLLDFFAGDKTPEFWGYFCQYDWVVFCWIFGRMVDLPDHFPQYCLDVKQLMETFGITRERLPEQEGTEHNALDDALWTKKAYERVWELERQRSVDPVFGRRT